MPDKMDETTLDRIGQLAERLDDSLFMAQNVGNLPPQTHVIGLSGTMKKVRDELVEIYTENGGTETLNIQAW